MEFALDASSGRVAVMIGSAYDANPEKVESVEDCGDGSRSNVAKWVLYGRINLQSQKIAHRPAHQAFGRPPDLPMSV
ncbi:uncharacterized protein N7498_002719 [Penicillium cinerascens]|uniref:Uncharacterized protein n=1 Tax=Penicillium cinerascens TaxID=70096 RepID=A0A9W9NAM4_9EURO|nr:uncharacterized protein N7498_002719 [Penicillium cinerascens]KAJ5216312.1 hypothetical protein N7498_002719 [Penicillium cinerascens]